MTRGWSDVCTAHMSLMDFEASRYFPQHSLSYPNYYYNDQNVPLAVAYATRADHHGYAFGGPVRSPSDQNGLGRNDLPPEPGPSRRRIAVAVSAPPPHLSRTMIGPQQVCFHKPADTLEVSPEPR